MAYNKKTWKARQGLGLNKFSIDGATPVPVINQPDSVTQQGDALSAGNLNDLEQRIADAFDDVEEGNDALQSQINQHESRLENLEQKAGDYTTVQYRGTDAVPTGKAKYGLVKSFVGKTRAWNQLCDNTPSSKTMNEITFTNNNDGSWTINGMATDDATITFSDAAPVVPANHKVLIALGIRTAIQGIQFGRGGFGYTNSVDFIHSYGTAFSARPQLKVEQGATVNNLKVYPKSFDLTLIFGAGNEPSTVADALAQLPALGQYNAYDEGSLVDTEVSGVKSVGVNRFDGVLESGAINVLTGEDTSTAGYSRFKNYCPVLPNAKYHFKVPSGQTTCPIVFYDMNKRYIGYKGTAEVKNAVFTTPSNCFFVRSNFETSMGLSEIQISACPSGTPTSVNTTFHEFMTDTLSLSEPVKLRSAGSMSDELDVESGEITRKIGSYTFTGNESGYSSSSVGRVYLYVSDIISIIKAPSSRNIKANILSAGWLPIDDDHLESNSMQISVTTSGQIGFCLTKTTEAGSVDALKAYLQNNETTIYFELASPSPGPDPIDPIPDNFLEVEDGGTIDTIQEQTPVIDNCLDVGYLAV